MLKTALKIMSGLIVLTLVMSAIKFGIEFDQQSKKLRSIRQRFTIHLDLNDDQKVVLARVGGDFNMKYENVETVDSHLPLITGKRLKTAIMRVNNDIVLLMYAPDDYNRVVRSVKIDETALSHITPDTEVIVCSEK